MSISWTTYLTSSFIIAAAYYAGIMVIYFRNDISMLVSTKSGSLPTDHLLQPVERDLFDNQSNNSPASLDAASAAPMHSLVDELQAYVHQSGQQGLAKEELHSSIKKILQRYPAIKGSVFQEGITNMIAVIVENNCAVHFNADELSGLWKT